MRNHDSLSSQVVVAEHDVEAVSFIEVEDCQNDYENDIFETNVLL